MTWQDPGDAEPLARAHAVATAEALRLMMKALTRAGFDIEDEVCGDLRALADDASAQLDAPAREAIRYTANRIDGTW